MRLWWALCAHKESSMAINLKEVDGVEIQLKHKATCHCGTVEIELDLPDGLVDVRRCDCSMCRRRGAIAASVPLSGINILKGSEALKLYQFNTKTAKHYFCNNQIFRILFYHILFFLINAPKILWLDGSMTFTSVTLICCLLNTYNISSSDFLKKYLILRVIEQSYYISNRSNTSLILQQ